MSFGISSSKVFSEPRARHFLRLQGSELKQIVTIISTISLKPETIPAYENKFVSAKFYFKKTIETYELGSAVVLNSTIRFPSVSSMFLTFFCYSFLLQCSSTLF